MKELGTSIRASPSRAISSPRGRAHHCFCQVPGMLPFSLPSPLPSPSPQVLLPRLQLPLLLCSALLSSPSKLLSLWPAPPTVPSACPGAEVGWGAAWQAESALKISASVPQIPQQNHQPQGPDPSCSPKKLVPHLAVTEGPGRVVHTWRFPLAPLPGGEAKPWRPCAG